MKFFGKIFSGSSRGRQDNCSRPPPRPPGTTSQQTPVQRHLHSPLVLRHGWEALRPTNIQGKSPLSCRRNALAQGKKQSKKVDITYKKRERVARAELNSIFHQLGSCIISYYTLPVFKKKH